MDPHNKNGEINQSDEILQLLNSICMSDEQSDVTFTVENTKIPAHKMILALRSSYFNSLFCGGFIEAKQDEIELKVPLDAFKAILKYIYTGCISLTNLDSDQITDVYDLAEQYGFEALKKIILEYFTVNLNLENCISILNAAQLYTLDSLQTTCIKFMDCHSTKLIEHDTFKTLSLSSLCTLLKRDTFYAPEIDIFKAICDWSKNNPGANIKEALSTVRWNEFSMNDYLNIVMPSNILDPTELSRVMSENRGSSKTAGRIKLITSSENSYNKEESAIHNSQPLEDPEKYVNENIATIEHGAKTIIGENPSALLNGNFTDYKVNSGCTYHAMTNEKLYDYYGRQINTLILVDLGKVRLINHIKMLLMDKDDRSYSYYIDVSVDGKNYITLFDHTKHYSRSWQYLYFQSRPVRFIKLVGTRCAYISQCRETSGSVSFNSFDVVGLQAMYSTINYTELVGGVIKPPKNISTVEYGTYVVRDTYCNGMNMLNTNPAEYSYHPVGDSFVLQYGQAYYIDSLRMLLGNENYSKKYSFCILTSLDGTNYEIAVDKRNESLSGWQEFNFIGRPAIFIAIFGTKIGNETFMCTYFECPRNSRRPTLKRPLKA